MSLRRRAILEKHDLPMSAKIKTDTHFTTPSSQPLVSVCMITYNHEKFIRQAIESVLCQRTNFQYELIIGEDGSTDNTRLICEEYSMRYSNVRLLPKGCNKGYRINFLETLKAASGKYVALCEGDDYWSDPQKLQQQFDVLERNAEVIICYHDADILYDNGVIECLKKKKKIKNILRLKM